MAKWEKPFTPPLLGRLKISQSIRRPLPASPDTAAADATERETDLAGFFIAIYEVIHLILPTYFFREDWAQAKTGNPLSRVKCADINCLLFLPDKSEFGNRFSPLLPDQERADSWLR